MSSIPSSLASVVDSVSVLAFADVGSKLSALSPFVAIGVPLIFVLAYLLVVLEELTHMRKSKPVMLAAGLIWTLIALFPPALPPDHPAHAEATAPAGEELNGSDSTAEEEAREAVGEAVKHYLMEYAELFLFLLVAMTYVNAMDERKIFDVLRDKLIGSGLGYRSLFWVTGFLSFFLSPVLDNMTTALITFGALAAVGRESPRFVALGAINLVVAANAGGAFSPFGDITTLMVWQSGKLPFFEFFALFLPALVNFVVPAACMHFAIP
ncbi:MAG: sodium:proton antiporter NhaD, partial [Planctomycetaceae bacterium]